MITLFTKSYNKDAEWLYLAIRSLRHFCKNPIRWIVVTERQHKDVISGSIRKGEEENTLLREIFPIKLEIVEDVYPEAMDIASPYMRQQWIKMNSWKSIGNDVAWNWDSDVIATQEFSRDSLLGPSGRPIYWFTPFNDMMGGSDDNAHRVRMQFLKEVFHVEHVSFEWMRCMPIPMNGALLRHASSTPIWNDCRNKLKAGDMRMSEFNIMGQFAHFYFPDAFEWRNTGQYKEHFKFCQQFWSYGGIPPNVREGIERL